MNFFLIGYYGFDNTGDDICLKKTKEIIISQFPNSKFNILGSKKKYINRINIAYVIYKIFKSDKVVFGGGGLCQNVTSSKSLYYYLFLIVISYLFRKPIYAISQGIGPIKGKINNWTVSRVLNCITFISLRDINSTKYLHKTRYSISADLAFYKQNILENKNKSNGIGINICSLKYQKEVNEIINTLNKNNYSFLSFSPNDYQLIKQLKVSNKPIRSIEYNNFYQRSTDSFHIIIAMRYHCCVWSALQGIPFLALAYDEKVERLAYQLKQPCLNLYKEKFELQQYKKIFMKLNKYYSDYQNNLHIQTRIMSNLCLLNEKVLIG